MAIRVVRLGSAREPNEGLRIGTVRRPPRGVRKEHFAEQNWYDVWFPLLSPSAEAVARGRAAVTDAEWSQFEKRFRKEMAEAEASRALDLLAALSHQTNLSVGCYCEHEARCHRSILRQLLAARGACFG